MSGFAQPKGALKNYSTTPMNRTEICNAKVMYEN